MWCNRLLFQISLISAVNPVQFFIFCWYQVRIAGKWVFLTYPQKIDKTYEIYSLILILFFILFPILFVEMYFNSYLVYGEVKSVFWWGKRTSCPPLLSNLKAIFELHFCRRDWSLELNNASSDFLFSHQNSPWFGVVVTCFLLAKTFSFSSGLRSNYLFVDNIF